MSPLLTPKITGYRFGCGRRESPMHALAAAERLAMGGDRWVWLACDLADAFGSIPRGRLLDLLKQWLPVEKFSEHIVRLCGPGKRGVPQGAPMSSTLMEVYRHKHLDRPFKKQYPDCPLLTYVDDLLILCRSETEAMAAHNLLVKLLKPTGMALNETKTEITDLDTGGRLDWLGYDVGEDDTNGLSIRISPRAWERLEMGLGLAHEKPNSPLYANALINGWVEQLGPCMKFERLSEIYERVTMTAERMEFHEIPSSAAIRSRWQRAHERWEDIRTRQEISTAQLYPMKPNFYPSALNDPNEAPF